MHSSSYSVDSESASRPAGALATREGRGEGRVVGRASFEAVREGRGEGLGVGRVWIEGTNEGHREGSGMMDTQPTKEGRGSIGGNSVWNGPLISLIGVAATRLVRVRRRRRIRMVKILKIMLGGLVGVESVYVVWLCVFENTRRSLVGRTKMLAK